MKQNLIRAFLAMTLLAAQTHAQNPAVIKIGEINSYSTAPQITGPYRNGWQLAVDEVNAAGGVNGRMLEVLPRDDAGKQDAAVMHAQALLKDDKVDVLVGTSLSNIGLAVSAVAAQHQKLFVAAMPLTDALTWDKGNRYTFRIRPSTYMQAAMLVDEAAKLPTRRWAILAPNYEYGQSAVSSFKLLLKARRPDVEFVGEEWPALGKLNAAAAVRALQQTRPDAIFNATYGVDLVNFVREGSRAGLFSRVTVASMLSGEPENIDLLGGAALKGWIVTGYPWEQIDTPEHNRFKTAYERKFHDHPRLASLIGYSTIIALAEGMRKAGSADSDKLVTAMRKLNFDTPLGPVMFRAVDQQSTMGAYIGRLDLKGGRVVMSDWHYADGKKFLPGDTYVRERRPVAAMR